MTAGLAMTGRIDAERIGAERNAEHTFLAVAVFLFAASATVTIVRGGAMSSMGGMPMPGGWTMAMAWMRMLLRVNPRPHVAGDGQHDPATRGTPRPPLRSLQRRPDGDPARHGVMNLRVMAVVTTPITAERLAPAGERIARAIGVLVVGAGALLIGRAAGLA